MKEKKHPIYSSLSLLCFNSFIASLILVVFSYFSILNLEVLVNSDIVFGVGMLLGFLALIFWENSKDRWHYFYSKDKRQKEKLLNALDDERKNDGNIFFRIVPYLFLFILFTITLNQFFKWDFVTAQMTRITILAITFGAITFWRNRERVEKKIENEKISEEKAEEKRAREFDFKFKRLSWFNFNYGVSSNWKERKYFVSILRVIISPLVWIARLPYSFVKWMYKEGWWNSGTLIGMLLFFSILFLLNIGSQYFWTDEAISFKVSSLILDTGKPVFENGASYNISPIYHYSVAFFMKIFGKNEFGSRVINVLAIVLVVIILYLIFKNKNKKLALLSCFIYLTLNLNLTMIRETRMYTLLTLIFLLISLYFLKIYGLFKETLDLKRLIILIVHSALFLLLFYVGYQIHAFVVFLIFALPLFFAVCFFKNPNKKDIALFLVSVVFILLIIFIQFNTLNLFVALTEKTTLDWAKQNSLDVGYYTKILSSNFVFYFLVPIFGIILSFLKKDNKLDLFISVFFVSLLIISYQVQYQLRYVYSILPLSIFILFYALLYLTKFFKNTLSKICLVIFFILLLSSQIVLFAKEYRETDNYNSVSIATHKKLDFWKIMECINKVDQNKTYIILADYQSALTLEVYNISVNYIILPKDDFHIARGDTIETYFNITYVDYKSNKFRDITQNENIIFVTREFWTFYQIEDYLDYNTSFYRPKVYSNVNISSFCS